MIRNAVDLQMTPGGIMPITHVSQYETGGRTLVFSLFDGDTAYAIPSGASAFLYGRRPDGVGFSVSCTILNGTLTAGITADMTVCAGRVECEIEIVSGQTRVSTENFILLVERAAYRTGGA